MEETMTQNDNIDDGLQKTISDGMAHIISYMYKNQIRDKTIVMSITSNGNVYNHIGDYTKTFYSVTFNIKGGMVR